VIHPEGKGNMLKGGKMPAPREFFQKGLHLGIFQIFSETLRCGSLAVTEPGGLGYTAIRKRGMGNETNRNFQNPAPFNKYYSASSGCKKWGAGAPHFLANSLCYFSSLPYPEAAYR
jgi:hypothetical protein